MTDGMTIAETLRAQADTLVRLNPGILSDHPISVQIARLRAKATVHEEGARRMKGSA